MTIQEPDEIWKPIPGYDEEYEVSNLGRTKSIKHGKERIRKHGVGTNGYLLCTLFLKGAQKSTAVHRTVMLAFVGEPNGLQVDHINGEKQDNRLENLRYCTQSQNNMNFKTGSGSSKYKGVWWYGGRKKWQAHITMNGKRKHLGMFLIEKQAARAYDKAAQELFGEYARLNFP